MSSDPSKWYSKLKRMSGQNKNRLNENETNTSELDGIYAKLQVIADHYAQISNVSQSGEGTLLNILTFHLSHLLSQNFVCKILKQLNDKAATVEGDLPVRVIKEFAEDLASPLSHLISESLAAGNYPNLWHI